MPRNYMSVAQRGCGFHGRQGGDIKRHLPPMFYTYIGRKLRARARRDAKIEAKRTVEIMKKQGRVEFPDDRAEAVFEAMVEIVITKLVEGGEAVGLDGNPKTVKPVYEYTAKERTNSASLVLNYAQVKPVIKTENVIMTAESWLASISDDDAK